MLTQYMLIGEVLKPQGVRGECKIKPYAADPDSFLDWDTLYFRDGETYTPVEARCSRVNDGFAYVTLQNCASMDEAEKLRGRELYIDRAHASALMEDEVYISDLIGCKAISEAGEEIGILTDVLQQGTVDTYVFRTPKGTMMAPALKEAFPEVDVEKQQILVNTKRLGEISVYED